jgi:hypothetical protein
MMPKFEKHFSVLDCLSDNLDETFDFIYGIAVIHMLVLDEDRDGFYQFIYRHLKSSGMALICTMGDGEFEMQSDINKAFELQEREHESGKMMVAGTSCRMVSFKTFEAELERNHFEIIEKGINERNVNTTRFAVLTRATVSEKDAAGKHSILMFSVRNEAGALAKAINIIGQFGYNMRCLRSRPMKELIWQYYFYMEVEGDLTSEKGETLLKMLEPYCDKLRMLGSFRYPAVLA